MRHALTSAHAASDADPRVRDAACFAIREFSEFLQPDISSYHATVLPAVFKCLDDAGEEVKEKAGFALESFAEHLEKQKFNPFLLQEFARKMCVRGDTSKYLRKLPKNALPSVNATRVQELKGLHNEVDIDNIGV